MANKEQVQSSNDYLSRTNTDCLKGIFAVIIALAHLKNYTTFLSNNIFGKFMGLMGYLVVGGFFFLSGYGLSMQLKNKGRQYIREFPLKRLLPLYSTCVVYTVVNFVHGLFGEMIMDLPHILYSLLLPGYGIGFGWYIQALFLFYILFWLFYLCFPNVNRIAGHCIINVVYFLILFIFKPMLWWQSILGAFFGCLFAESKERIDDRLIGKKRVVCVFVFTMFLFGVTTIVGSANAIEDMWFAKILKMFSVVFFIAVLLQLLRWVNVNNKITLFLGDISMGIYCVQMIFMELFHSQYIYIYNDVFYCVLTLVCTIATAWLLNPLIKLLNKKIKLIIKSRE